MLRVLKSLLVLLIAAIFSVATINGATALPCVGNHVEMTSAEPSDPDCHPAATLAKDFAPHHETDGKCVHCCCAAPATPALAEITRQFVARRVVRSVFPMPTDTLGAGLSHAPLIGPPKLSA
jgi:hypothetical protein